MDYSDLKPIYLQIVDTICEHVLNGSWPAGERIPSLREMAITMQVNPNTLMRSYSYLEEQEIISMSRGVGYFLADDARKRVLALKKQEFLSQDMPKLFKMMDLLEMDVNELIQLYHKR
ncbi:MAG: GntR family transcriptional regulator [Pseudomonadota bacterium]|nr:GntR family transcriptional regulator [Pseudomonadota bacterium]